MRGRGKSQLLLPTPQTSITSGKEDFLLSSEIEVEVEADYEASSSSSYSPSTANVNYFKRNLRDSSCPLKSFTLKRPRLLRNRSKVVLVTRSSWPFRSNSGDKFFNFQPDSVSDFNKKIIVESKDLMQLKRLLNRDFPYDRVIEKLSSGAEKLLFKRELWRFLLKVSTIYTGDDFEGDRQKKNEIAFAAWTTILRVYGKSRVRGGEEQLERLAIAAVVLQSKLLEESEVDLYKLENKISKLTTKTTCEKAEIEASERKICHLLDWKLLVPSPQVILFSVLDAFSLVVPLPATLKLLVSKVMDELIENFMLQEYLKERDEEEGLLSGLVISVIEIVLTDFFSVFQEGRIDAKKVLQEGLKVEGTVLSSEQRGKIEKAIETVMSSCNA